MAPHDPNMVAALRRERAGYKARGMTDRVAQVDEQLAHYGADDIEAPQGRTGSDPDQQTATGGIVTGPVPAVGENGPEQTAATAAGGTAAAAAIEPTGDSPPPVTTAPADTEAAKPVRRRPAAKTGSSAGGKAKE